MIDRSQEGENADAPATEPAAPEPALAEHESMPDPSLAALEERVRRLEESLAQLQDTQQLETRIAGRVLEQVKEQRPTSSARETTAIMLGAGRHLGAAAAGVLQAQADAAETQARTTTPPVKQAWLLVDLFADLRTLFRMCRDPRYRTIWFSRALLPLALVAAIFTSGLWLQLIPPFMFLPKLAFELVDKGVDLFLAFVLCKALQREIRRYREAVPDQAPVRQS